MKKLLPILTSLFLSLNLFGASPSAQQVTNTINALVPALSTTVALNVVSSNVGYGIILVGNTNYPNLDTAIPIANAQGKPVQMGPGFFPETNDWVPTVPIIGMGPNSVIQMYSTNGSANNTPNFGFTNNSDFENFQVFVETPNTNYEEPFGTGPNTTWYCGGVNLENILCTNATSDIIDIAGVQNGGGTITISGSGPQSPGFQSQWDNIAINNSSNWYGNVSDMNIQGIGPNFVTGGTPSLSACFNTIGRGEVWNFQNCYLSANNTNSYGVYVHVGASQNPNTYVNLINCVVTNWTGSGLDPTNYVNDSPAANHTNHIAIIGGDVNPAGVSWGSSNHRADTITETPMFQYFSANTSALTNGTENSSCGVVELATGKNAYYLTNSTVTTNSVIICSIGTDATATSISATNANGLIVFTANSIATGNPQITWMILNPLQ